MSMHRVTTTQITGLSASGTTDALGSWNTSVDLGTFVTVPSGATAVVLSIENAYTQARYTGVRTSGKTTALCIDDQPINSLWTVIVPLGAGNTIDIYTEDVTAGRVQFYVTGFCSSAWTFYDIDNTLPYLPITTNNNTGITAAAAPNNTSIPANATIAVIDFQRQWKPVGEASTVNAGSTTASTPNVAFLKVDASSQVYINSTVNKSVIGFVSTGVNWASWLGSAELTDAGMTKGAWTTGPSTFSGKSFAYIQPSTLDGTHGFAVRGQGESAPSLSPTNAAAWGMLAPLISGRYEYFAESAVTHNSYYAAATFDEATVASTNSGRSLLLGVG